MIGTVKLYAYAAALAAVLALVAFAHHKVYAQGEKAGEAAGAKIAAAAEISRVRAETARDQLAAAVKIANDAVEQQRRDAAAQAAVAQQAVAAAAANARDADRALKAWMDKYARAARDPDCAKTLQEQLCAGVADF
jgi:hypothetical protein